MFVLPAPDQLISGRQSDHLSHGTLSLGHESAEITPADVGLDHNPSLHVFATDLRGPRIDEDAGHT